MVEFRLGRYPQSSILVVYSERRYIQLDPDYQRVGGIWTKEKRQLLVDSLLNGFDVPKLYFHEFVPAKTIKGKHYRYAIVDGQQRLKSIWDFIDGLLSLPGDFTYLRDSDVNAGGLTYAELGNQYPDIKSRFDGTPLDIVTIQTDDLDLIEDMFSRLNEAVPLNAPEKRNALRGPMPRVITQVAGHTFFAKKVPFKDKRYRHRDLAAKCLFIEHHNDIVNTKKSDLDDFVRDFKKWRSKRDARGSQAAVTQLQTQTKATLAWLVRTFAANDPLLRQVGMITLYYYLARNVRARKVDQVNRSMLKWFEQLRQKNREKAEAEAGDVDQSLLEFDRHSQAPNDAYALRIRLSILLRHLRRKYKVKSARELTNFA